MTLRKLILKGGLKLGANQGVAQACSFLKNVILARLISPEDFGIAATLAITFSLFEMVSNLASEILLVQAKDGDEPRLQRTAHLLRAGRGLLNAALIFLLAGPIAGLFGAPETAWAFRCLAVVPLLKGFMHLDMHRVQRAMNFGPMVAVNIASNVLVLLAAWPLADYFRDYQAMLWLLVLQTALATLGSHVVAERPYGWSWDAAYARRIAAFGWPLLVNGILMFIIFDGDRFVIGSAQKLFPASSFTLADLGVYSVAFSLTMAPTMVVANIMSNLFLPVLSQAQTAREEFHRRYELCTQAITMAGLATAVGFIIAGGALVTLIFGEKYAAASAFIGILGAMWGLRTLRIAPTLAAMALGDTKNAMASNIARSVALPAMLFSVGAGLGLPSIAVCGLVGELLAMLVCVARLKARHGVSSLIAWRGCGIYVGGTAIAGMIVWGGLASLNWMVATFEAVLVITLLMGVALTYFSALRAALWRSFSPAVALRTNIENSPPAP
ncbi:MAG TPA: oligosaccharide flippase family protein [Terriglobia bacterium]|nr:oligosaccharide flippase family protein [Terriglobia bacterium]